MNTINVEVKDRANGKIITIELPTGETIKMVVIPDGVEITTHYDNGSTAVIPKCSNQFLIKNIK